MALKPLNSAEEPMQPRFFVTFWATICKTVWPMLSDRFLSVCAVCLVSGVGVLWPNGCIEMKLGAEVGLGPGHIVLDGDPAPPPQKGHSPQFSACVCRGQTSGWMKMPVGTEVNLSPGNNVLDGDPAPPKKGSTAPPILAHVLWPNGCIDQDATLCYMETQMLP